ncbi:MAG: hypothetical protein MJK12_20290 [Colwellia sp.]|nr:hypothetical protein [Colwellia sp.]
MKPKGHFFKKNLLTVIGLSTLISTWGAVAYAADESQFSKTLQSEMRSEKDKARDAGRKPQQVMQFFGIEPGMTVLEILSSGGYYTEVLSYRVGNKGKVLAHNNQFILQALDGRFGKQFTERTANNRLANVSHYQKEFGEFDLSNEVDVVTVVLNYHDLYSRTPKEKRMKILAQLKRALKPDGVLGLIDMEAGSAEHNPDLHRIHHQRVRDEFIEAGFVLDSEADFLKNSQDDYSKMVFDPSVRGKTDRFVFKFKKASI